MIQPTQKPANPKRGAVRPALWSALTLLSAPAMAGAQNTPPPFTVTPEGVAVPNQVAPTQGASGVATLAQVKGISVGNLGAAPARSVELGLGMGQVLSGTLTLSQAWEQKLIGRDDVIEMLGRAKLESVPQEKQEEMRLGLAGLLAGTLTGSEASWKEVSSWNSTVRLSLADYFRSARDERAVRLYEELLVELDGQVKKNGLSNSVWITPLANLALFYSEQKQWRNAAESWDRAPQYSRRPLWLADASFMAGRAYFKAEDKLKAREAYQRVPQYGDGFFTGIVITEQAGALIEAGKHQEARELLKTPLLGGGRVEVVRILVLCNLAFSYYQTGEWDKTLALIKEIDQRSALFLKDGKEPEQGLRQWVPYTRQFARYIENWKQAPLVVWPENVSLAVEPAIGKALATTKRISLRTFRPASFGLSVDNPHVKATLTQGDWTGIRRQYAEQEVTLEVDPQALVAGQKQITAMLTVTMEQTAPNPPFKTRVPLTITRSAAP